MYCGVFLYIVIYFTYVVLYFVYCDVFYILYVVRYLLYCDVFCALQCVVCIVIDAIIVHCAGCERWDVCGTYV